jgi:hypothetical protein
MAETRLVIGWPKKNSTVTAGGTKRTLVVTGRADQTITGVTGSCTPSGGGTAILPSNTLFFPQPHQSGGIVYLYRWMLVFQAPPGKYDLSASDSTGTVNAGPVKSVKLVAEEDFTDVLWPGQGDIITDYADDFTPSGDLDTNPLGPVTLKAVDALGTVQYSVECVYSFGDPTVLKYWVAQFASIPCSNTLTYVLTVQDSQGNASSVTGLQVKCPHFLGKQAPKGKRARTSRTKST